MIILIDMDGVLTQFEEAIIEGLSRNNQIIELPKDRKNFLRKWCNKEQKEIIDKICNKKGFFLSLKEIKGAINAVKDIAKKHEVFFCSSPLSQNKESVKEKQLWIEENFGKEWIRRLIITKDKTLIKGDILIDDNPNEIKGIENPEWEHIIFDQPYNLHIKNKKRINWKNYKRIIP